MANAGGCDLNRSILKVCIQAVCLLISVDQVSAAETIRREVRAESFRVQDVLTIARQAHGKTPASLDLICSQTSALHLILSTRLPGPRWSIEQGRDDNVSLFIGDTDHELNVVMKLVKKGRDLSWLESAISREGEGELDTLVTTPLAVDDAAIISLWFGSSPPSKVSIVGYAETGVFMAGIVSGRAISEFSSSCVAK
jgi:hypothetical protein